MTEEQNEIYQRFKALKADRISTPVLDAFDPIADLSYPDEEDDLLRMKIRTACKEKQALKRLLRNYFLFCLVLMTAVLVLA